MLKLDNNLLDELGLGSLPTDQKRPMLQHIYDTLELRVGTTLANQMTDQQLDEFERFIDSGGDTDQAQALQWLEANLPNYKQVVNDVFGALKGEIRQMAPQILAASGSQAPVAVPGPTSAPAAPAPGPTLAAQDDTAMRQPDPVAAPGLQQPAYGLQPNQAANQPASGSGGSGSWGASLQQHPGQPPASNQPYPAQQPPAGPGGGAWPDRREGY